MAGFDFGENLGDFVINGMQNDGIFIQGPMGILGVEGPMGMPGIQGPIGGQGDASLTLDEIYSQFFWEDERRFRHRYPLASDLKRAIEYDDFGMFAACLDEIAGQPDAEAILMSGCAIHAVAAKPDVRWLALILQVGSTILPSLSLAINVGLLGAMIQRVNPGDRPIHVASKYGTPRHLQLLLDHGADSLAVDRRRNNAFHVSVRVKNCETTRFWLAHYTDLCFAPFGDPVDGLLEWFMLAEFPTEMFRMCLREMVRRRVAIPAGTIERIFRHKHLNESLYLEYSRALLRADHTIMSNADPKILLLRNVTAYLDMRMVEMAIATSSAPCASMSEERRLCIREEIFFYGLLERLLEWI